MHFWKLEEDQVVVRIAEFLSEGRTIKPFSLARALELAEDVREEWGGFLTPSFRFTVTENETFWKIIARDDKGFRSSAMMMKKRTFEQRLIGALKGLINDYFLYHDYMPRSWGHE